MAATVFPAPSSGGATTPIGASSLLYSGASPYGGTSLTGLSLAAGTYAITINQQNAERGYLTTANNGKFMLNANGTTYVTLTTTETTFNIAGGISANMANMFLGRGNIQQLTSNSNDTLYGMALDEQANGTYRLRFSTDNIYWSSPTTYPSNFNSNNYIYANQKRLGPYISFTRNSTNNNFTFTTDGITWNTSTPPGNTYYRGDVSDYNASLSTYKWIIRSDVSYNSTPAGGRIGISTDGVSWTEVTATTLGFDSSGSSVQSVALSSTATAKYVAMGTVGGTTGRIMSSTDGVTWASRTVPSSPAGITNFAYCVWNPVAGKYLAQTNVENTFVISTDGVTWSSQTVNITGFDAVYSVSTGFWIHSMYQAKIAHSTNGTTWNYIQRTDGGYYFPGTAFAPNDYTNMWPRYNGTGADKYVSHAQDNNSQYGTNRHIRITLEPLTYTVYSTAIATA